MFKTTAGEVRRRLADGTSQDLTLLGSSWHNEDIVFLVAFTGDYPMRPGPPAGTATTAPLPHGTLCTYMGSGKKEADAWAQFGTAIMAPPTTIEGFFGR